MPNPTHPFQKPSPTKVSVFVFAGAKLIAIPTLPAAIAATIVGAGKISNECVPTTKGEPQKIELLLMAALNEELKFALSQRLEPGNDLATNSFERTERSVLQ